MHIISLLSRSFPRVIPGFLLLSLFFILPLHAAESQVAAQIKQFTDSVIEKLEPKALKGTTIGIADFDNRSEEAAKANLGFAVSEIMTEQFEKSGKFQLVEKKQINRLLNSMEMSLTGLYDSDKAPSIGKLVNARYLIVGSVSKLAGFYRVAVRVVAVETSSILLSDSIDLDSELLEDTAKKYQPPRYRLHIGSSMSWFGMNDQGNAMYSLGLAMGVHYNLSGSHWLMFQGIFFFDHFIMYNSVVDVPVPGASINVSYSLKNALVLQTGYGYRFSLSRSFAIQPNLFFGWITARLQQYETYYLPSSGSFENTLQGSYQSLLFMPRVDVVLMEKEPVSFYIGLGYYHYFHKLRQSFEGLLTQRLLNGVKLEGAIMVFF